MSLDVYAPCPCGSGKKVKFCCIDIMDEMAKVERLHANNQPRMAVKVLEELQERFPTNSWVLLNRANLLMMLGEEDQAQELLEDFVAAHPENSDGMALYAALLLQRDGYELAKPALYRALQKPTAQSITLLAGLVNGISQEMAGEGKYMSARQHLVLAIRLVPEESRQQAFMNLLHFDSDKSIPYPLRSVHELARYRGPDEHAKDAARATRLAQLGCFEMAADIFERLAAELPDDALLHYNHGLCRAWDADEVSAAAALHRAAELEPDFEQSVEYETIAQLLDRGNSESAIRIHSRRYPVNGLSRLLTQLDANDRLVRIPVAPDDTATAAIFGVLDRPYDEAAVNLDDETTVPLVLAWAWLQDAASAPEGVATATVHVRGDELAQEAFNVFETAAGEVLDTKSAVEEVDSEIPPEDLGLYPRYHLPESVGQHAQRQWNKALFDRYLNEEWPRLPLIGLGGKSPLEVVGDPAYRLRLTAAVHVLDAACEVSDRIADLVPLWQKLQLAPPQPLEVDRDASLASLSPMQVDRLQVEKLSDAQLINLLSRVMLLGHRSFQEKMLAEFVKRPACTAEVEVHRIYSLLVQIARARFDIPQALYWVREARSLLEGQPNAFETELSWSLHEAVLRVESPDDPDLPEFLQALADRYGRKIPGFRERMAALAQSAGIEVPWGEPQGIVTPEGMGSEAGELTPGGLWTPGAADAPSATGGSKKLWIPGLE